MGQGLWQFKVMPFGLCNAPATFERLMETVLGVLSYEACLVYLDDIIIVGRSFEEHLKNIRRVLQKLKEANLKLSPSKCHLFRREVIYLGHIISAEGFLGLMHVLPEIREKFLNDRQTTPYADRTEKQKFICTVDCNNAFKKLKDALTSAPILAYPEIGKQFILDTDASHESIGVVLYRGIDGQEHVIAYFSKCLSKSEGNYCVTRKKLLTILVGYRDYRSYEVEIRHRKGSAHGNADDLSRRPCPESCKYCSRIEKKFGLIEPIARQVTTPSTLALDPWSDESVRKDQLVAINTPKTKFSTVLKELHGSPTGGHFGVMKTLQKVRERFYSNNVRSDVEKCCRICDPYDARKGPRKLTRGRLQLYNVGAPFE
ncbi:retrovirus-related Pol polyprotein from transposon 17.6 [Trichonephila clavipes]|nr:retrovirus-related Pol polyprotein from transposon 17.6 [Trichonephila clavipes]